MTEILWLVLALFFVLKVIRAFSKVSFNGGLWNIIQIGFMMLGCYYLLQKPKLFTNRPIMYLTMFSVFAVVLALPYFRKFTLMRVFDFVTIPYGALALVLFYCLGLRTDIEKPTIIKWVYYVIAAILMMAMRKFYVGGAIRDEKGAVADVYYILGLLPLMLLYTSKKWAWFPIAVAAAAIVLAGKRAGLLALVAMLAVYLWLELRKFKSTSEAVKYILAAVLLIFVMYQVLVYLDEFYHLRFLERMERLSEDGGSGRDKIWLRLLNRLKTFDFLEVLTGRGKGSVRRDVGIEAHNDFLHLLYENGLISVLLYVAFYLSLLRQASRMFRDKYPHAGYFLMSVICSLFLAMFSFYVIDPSYITCGVLCAGLYMADYQKFGENQKTVRLQTDGH